MWQIEHMCLTLFPTKTSTDVTIKGEKDKNLQNKENKRGGNSNQILKARKEMNRR